VLPQRVPDAITGFDTTKAAFGDVDCPVDHRPTKWVSVHEIKSFMGDSPRFDSVKIVLIF
jgi:hypothetical protein